ncbi:uncharacterized protein LOC134195877 [Corticium candelabrum]|uniref:uncharacterized protein LOC134195877 n=1 Tax=Corticium candelabrum TaxID=121492 RepID=UPI002E25F6DC|nr:uncharacterized protein LOC134195877 [Corticium candelabrum]
MYYCVLILTIFVLTVVKGHPGVSPSGFPSHNDDLHKAVQTYITWGSTSGKPAADCNRFLSIFAYNRTWASPFAGTQFFSYDVDKSCQQLNNNLSWHVASQPAGNYLYPFYDRQVSSIWQVAFTWRAVGGANEWSKVLTFKQYDFEIITTLWFQRYDNNVSYVFAAKDFFWPAAGDAFPDPLRAMVEKYASFLGGDCSRWAELFLTEVASIGVSNGTFYGPSQIKRYCSRMMSMWSSYVFTTRQMSYSVNPYTESVENVGFTWTRTGVREERVCSEEVLTLLTVQPDDSPTRDLKISTAMEYFQPSPVC